MKCGCVWSAYSPSPTVNTNKRTTGNTGLHPKCLYTEIFLVRIFPSLD